MQPPEHCDLAIVGGGIVGLAVARELIARNPRASVCVLEREAEIGTHQTGHNSGVIHAGVYYAPGSLKARLCVEGAREMYEYCEQRGIAHEPCGKVPGLRRIDAAGIRELEPHARGVAGLHSPRTGIADFAAVARSYARDILDAGATVATGCGVGAVGVAGRSLRLTHAHGSTEAAHAPAPTRTRGSCRSAAPTCAWRPSAATWSAR
jgi:L-2-hydroxyglutarate oxidase